MPGTESSLNPRAPVDPPLIGSLIRVKIPSPDAVAVILWPATLLEENGSTRWEADFGWHKRKELDVKQLKNATFLCLGYYNAASLVQVLTGSSSIIVLFEEKVWVLNTVGLDITNLSSRPKRRSHETHIV